jgi:hypothetical protein
MKRLVSGILLGLALTLSAVGQANAISYTVGPYGELILWTGAVPLYYIPY